MRKRDDGDRWRLDFGDVEAAIRPNTRLLFGETLGNPGLEVLDIPRIADVAHEAGLPLMIDSTFTTPYLCRPFDLGADIVMHSATKFLSGHGVVIGGLLDELLHHIEVPFIASPLRHHAATNPLLTIGWVQQVGDGKTDILTWKIFNGKTVSNVTTPFVLEEN